MEMELGEAVEVQQGELVKSYCDGIPMEKVVPVLQDWLSRGWRLHGVVLNANSTYCVSFLRGGME